MAAYMEQAVRRKAKTTTGPYLIHVELLRERI
jgi:hypothetical protein